MLTQTEIFKPGRHLAENGRYYEFTEADIAAIAASYSPAVSAAPVVIGHPKTNDPAFGWVKGLTVNAAGVLVADLERVMPEFAEVVDNGHYRNRSASLYEPADPRNPTPGQYYLRHVGYLGAKAPAIKGLEAAFSEAAAADFGLCFSVPDREIGFVARAVAQVVRRLRDYFIAKEGLEAADKILPAFSDEWLTEIAAQVSAEQPTGATWSEAEIADQVVGLLIAQFAEAEPAQPVASPALIERERRIAEREAALTQREASFAEGQLAGQRAEDAAFIDGLVAEGRLPPGHRDGVLALFAHAGGDSAGASFSEGDDARATLRQLLEATGVSISFAEHSPGGGGLPTDDPARIAQEISTIRAEAAGRGESLSASQAAQRLGR